MMGSTFEDFIGMFPTSSQKNGLSKIGIPPEEEYFTNNRLTLRGINYLLKTIGEYTNSPSGNQEIRIEILIKYGQSYGGSEFIRLFDELVEDEKRQEIYAHLIRQFQQLGMWEGESYEFPQEREARQRMYGSMQSAVDGYDTYATHQVRSLLFESERYVKWEAVLILDSLALVNPDGFVSLSRDNILWALRWIDRLPTIDIPLKQTVHVLEHLPEAFRGVVLAKLWEQAIDCIEDANRIILCELVIQLHQRLNTKNSLQLLGRALSWTVNVHRKQLEQGMHSFVEAIVTRIADWWAVQDVNLNDFLPHVHGVSNREPLWVVLLLARVLYERHPSSLSISAQLQTAVVDSYPDIWRILNQKSSEQPRYYFSEDQTILIIGELASAIVSLHRENSIEYLSNCNQIPEPASIMRMVDLHRADNVTFTLLLIHSVCTTGVLLEMRNHSLLIDESVWNGVFGYIIRSTKQIERNYKRTAIDNLLMDKLLNNLGQLFSEMGYPDNYVQWLNWLNHPGDLLSLRNSILEQNRKGEISEICRSRLSQYVAQYPRSEILSIGQKAIVTQESSLSVSLLESVNDNALKPEEFARWKNFLAIAFLNLASQSDVGLQIEYLQKAIFYATKPPREGHQYTRIEVSNLYLSFEIRCWMYDRNVISALELSNRYNRIAIHDGTIGVETAHTAEPYQHNLVRALTLIRIIDGLEGEHDFYIRQMEMVLQRLAPHTNKPLIALIQSWYTKVIEGKGMDPLCIATILRHSEKFSEQTDWLPGCLLNVLRDIIQ